MVDMAMTRGGTNNNNNYHKSALSGAAVRCTMLNDGLLIELASRVLASTGGLSPGCASASQMLHKSNISRVIM